MMFTTAEAGSVKTTSSGRFTDTENTQVCDLLCWELTA
jgi:hypothetical protein